ncbi:putative oxidoreductase FixC [Budvicia aquatica]|nr:putative oxidoreductase FixC [Budvicia aquatica]
MSDLFTVDGRPAEPLHKKMRRQCKRVGYWNLIKDAVKGVRSI